LALLEVLSRKGGFMPTPQEILSGLSTIANQWQILAIAWHIYFALLVGGLALGIRPSKRIAGIMLTLPLVSVSALAWLAANPFNGILFALAAIALLVIAIRLPQERIHVAPLWLLSAGALLFIFGWVYPHFLTTASWLPYLYAAPTGLVPCPTLSIVIGLSLMVDNFESRAWSFVLGGMGLFYGLFGALRLGVTIDLVLLLGALLTLLMAFLPKTGTPKQVLAH
jgi:hypothetical protein